MSRLWTQFLPGVPVSSQLFCKFSRFPLEINISFSFSTLVIFVVSAASSSPIILVFVSFYIWISIKVQRYYMNFLREVTRLKGVSSSPVVQNFKEGIEGVSTVRIHGNQHAMFSNYLGSINELQKNNISIFAAKNWFKLRISIMSMMVVIPCILISVSIKLTLTLIDVPQVYEFGCVCSDAEFLTLVNLLYQLDLGYCE